MTDLPNVPDLRLLDVDANGIRIHVAAAGHGPPMLLLHGFPHTWALWRKVMPRLAQHFRVIAPDLRGLGKTTRALDGYDLHTLADDEAALLDALDARGATVVGIDAGAPIAWMLAMRHPRHVTRLAVTEALLGALPGAESFLAKGPPWWFAFHAVAGLPELLVEGREEAYLDYFLTNGTFENQGVAPETRAAFLEAYQGREALRCAFAHYRAFPTNAAQIATMVATERTTIPTLALSGGVVGGALARQLAPYCDALYTRTIERCGHIVPEDQPEALAAHLIDFAHDAM